MSDSTFHDPWHDVADDPRASYEHHPVEDIEPLPERDCTACGEYHLHLVLWLSEPYARQRAPHKAWQRTAVYLWLVAPDKLPWSTVEAMADALRLSRRHVQAMLAEARGAVPTRPLLGNLRTSFSP